MECPETVRHIQFNKRSNQYPSTSSCTNSFPY